MRFLIASWIILNLAIASTNYSDNFGRYFEYEEVDRIVDQTRDEITNKYILNIDLLQENLFNLRNKYEQLTNSYETTISIMIQKHDLELQAKDIKMKLNHNKYLFGGLAIGIGSVIGVVTLLDSVEMPLFTIKF